MEINNHNTPKNELGDNWAILNLNDDEPNDVPIEGWKSR